MNVGSGGVGPQIRQVHAEESTSDSKVTTERTPGPTSGEGPEETADGRWRTGAEPLHPRLEFTANLRVPAVIGLVLNLKRALEAPMSDSPAFGERQIPWFTAQVPRRACRSRSGGLPQS
jgi:hypothetical protein